MTSQGVLLISWYAFGTNKDSEDATRNCTMQLIGAHKEKICNYVSKFLAVVNRDFNN